MLCSLDRSTDPPSDPHMFRISLPATAEAVAGALERLAVSLQGLSVDPGICGDVAITMGEVLNNVVEHACVDMDAAEVTLQGGTDKSELYICVCDPGRAFEGDILPEGREVNLAVPVESLPEGGFGWFLIRSLTSGIEYRREHGHNCLTLRFAL